MLGKRRQALKSERLNKWILKGLFIAVVPAMTVHEHTYIPYIPYSATSKILANSKSSDVH